MKTVRRCLLALACSLAIPAAAQAETLNSPTGAAIPVPNSSTNNVGSINVEGANGTITDIDVNVTVTHGHPDDLDIALLSPDGTAQVLISDVCGSADLTSTTFTLDQDAAEAVSDGGPCPVNTAIRRRPTNAPSGAGSESAWSAPGAPTGTSSADLDGFDGQNPNGAWRLFVADDLGNNTGTINSWSITIETTDSEVVIPAGPGTSGTSGPYPMTKSFGIDGVITDLNLNITGFRHQRPRDVDMVLQGPTGEAVMVMSDACGDAPLRAPFNWLFDDEAALGFSELNANDCIQNVRKPSAFGEAETMPAPAPAGPYSTSLSTFDNLGGGDWRLYVNDDTAGETGFIESWEIVVQTRPASATGFASTAVSTAEGQSAQLTVTRGAPAAGPATVDVGILDGSADASDLGSPLPTQVTFAAGETSKTIAVPVNADPQGEQEESFFVALANASNDAALADATAFATVTIARSEADNRFTVGKPKRKNNGTAKIPVTIPGPGRITTRDATEKELVRQTTIFTDKVGTVNVKVRPARDAKRLLRSGEKVKVKTEVVYTPLEGTPNSTDVKLKLKDS